MRIARSSGFTWNTRHREASPAAEEPGRRHQEKRNACRCTDRIAVNEHSSPENQQAKALRIPWSQVRQTAHRDERNGDLITTLDTHTQLRVTA